MDFSKFLLVCLIGALCISKSKGCMIDLWKVAEKLFEPPESGTEVIDTDTDYVEVEDDFIDDYDLLDDDFWPGPDCESAHLQKIIAEEMDAGGDENEVGDAIANRAEEEFGSKFKTICSTKDFAYQNWYKDRLSCKTNNGQMWCLIWQDYGDSDEY